MASSRPAWASARATTILMAISTFSRATSPTTQTRCTATTVKAISTMSPCLLDSEWKRGSLAGARVSLTSTTTVIQTCFWSQAMYTRRSRRNCLVGVTRQFRLDLRVYIACDQKQVWITVVVEVNDTRAPASEPRFHSESSRQGDIVEIAFTVVAVQRVCVVGEVALENVEMAIKIVVARADAHAGLLDAIVAERSASLDAFFA